MEEKKQASPFELAQFFDVATKVIHESGLYKGWFVPTSGGVRLGLPPEPKIAAAEGDETMAQVTTGGESEPISFANAKFFESKSAADCGEMLLAFDPFLPNNTVRLVTTDHWKMHFDWLPPITAPAAPLYRKLAHRLGSWLLSI